MRHCAFLSANTTSVKFSRYPWQQTPAKRKSAGRRCCFSTLFLVFDKWFLKYTVMSLFGVFWNTINRQQLRSVLYSDLQWEETWNFVCWVQVLHHVLSYCTGPSQVSESQNIGGVLMVFQKGQVKTGEWWRRGVHSSESLQHFCSGTRQNPAETSTLSSELLQPRLSVRSLILKDFN